MPFSRDVENLIANLRGVPENHSVSITRSSLLPIDSLMQVLIEKHQLTEEGLEQRIMEAWPELVGKRSANRCRPVRLDEAGRLIVKVDNPTVRNEMRFDQRNILKRIHALPGGPAINALHII